MYQIEEYRVDPDFIPPWYQGEERFLLYSNDHKDDKDLHDEVQVKDVRYPFTKFWSKNTNQL